MIDIDMIVTFLQIDGEIAAKLEASSTNAFDEDGYSLDTLVLGVVNLTLNRNFLSYPLILWASFILFEIIISHIKSSVLLGPCQKSEI